MDKHLTTLKEIRSTKATDEQIAVVEKRIKALEDMLDEFVVQADNMTPIGKERQSVFEEEIEALTAILDELKALREENAEIRVELEAWRDS